MHNLYVHLIAYKSQQLSKINLMVTAKDVVHWIQFKKVPPNNEDESLVEKNIKLEQQSCFRDNAEFNNQHLT